MKTYVNKLIAMCLVVLGVSFADTLVTVNTSIAEVEAQIEASKEMLMQYENDGIKFEDLSINTNPLFEISNAKKALDSGSSIMDVIALFEEELKSGSLSLKDNSIKQESFEQVDTFVLTNPNSRNDIAVDIAFEGGDYASEWAWGILDANEVLVAGGGNSGDTTINLSPGVYTVLLADTFGDGWGGGTITFSSSGTTLFGPMTQLSGESDCSYSVSYCLTYMETYGSAGYSSFGEEYYAIYSDALTVEDPNANVACDDSTACNYGELGSCTFPASDDFNCDGSCGGVNGSVEDCTGVCAGTTLDTDWACDPENISVVSGTTLDGDTGNLYDSGGPDGDYSSNEDFDVIIDNGSGDTLILEFSDFNSESGYDELMINGVEYEGNLGAFTLNITSGSAQLVWNSDSGVQYDGFALSWSYMSGVVEGCTDDAACNYDSSANLDDGSCVVPGSCDFCEDSCSDGTSLDQASCEAATCSGVDGWDETEAGCDNSVDQVGTAQVGTPASDDYVAPQDNTLVWTEGGTCSDGVATSEEDCDNSTEQVGTPASDDYQPAVENTLVWTDGVAGSCSDGVAESAEDCDNSSPQVGTAASDDYAPNSATFTAGAAGSCSDGVSTSEEDCDNGSDQVGTAESCADGDYFNSTYWETCATFVTYPQWCNDANDYDNDVNGDGVSDGYDVCCSCGAGTTTPASDDYQAAVPNTLVWTDASADSCSEPTGNTDTGCNYTFDDYCDDGSTGLTQYCAYGTDCTDCGNCESDLADWDGTEAGCDNGAGTPASDDFVAAVENTLVWTDAVAGSCSDGVAESAEDCDNSSAQVGTAASDDYAPAQENTLEWTNVGSCSDGVSTSQEDCDNSVAQVGTPASDDYAPASDDYAPAVENSAVYYGGGTWSVMNDGDADDDGVCNDLDQCADADDNGGACECANTSGTSQAAMGQYSFTSFEESCADADGFGAVVTWTVAENATNQAANLSGLSGTSYLYLMATSDCALDDNDLFGLQSGGYALQQSIELEAGECMVWQGYDWYGNNYSSSYPEGTALVGNVTENTDPALTGCMEPLACDYCEDCIYPADCDFATTGYDCDDNCIGVPDDPNTPDADETQTCGCTDVFSNNPETGVLNDPSACDYTGRYSATWTLNTPGAWASEVRQLLCFDEAGTTCVGYNTSGLSSSETYVYDLQLVDGQTYYMFSRDSYNDGWCGNSYCNSATDGDGSWNVVENVTSTEIAGATSETNNYGSSWTVDAFSHCTGELDCAGVCNGESVIDECGQCGGLNSNQDCAGTCSGDLSSGTWINGNPGSQDQTLPPYINGTADDGSWSLSDCYYTSGSGVNTDNGDGTVSITAEYSTGDCMFTSSIFNGQISVITSTTHNADMSLVGPADFTLSGGAHFSFSSTGTYVDFTADGSLTGDLPGGLLGGLVDDCNSECGGTAYVDYCEDCVGGSTGLEECVADCAGVFEGQEGYGSDFDDCGVCDNYIDSDGVQPAFPYGTCDCEGTPNGTVVIDDCGTCGGLNAAQDCFGDCDGIGFTTDDGDCAYPAFDAITDLVATTSDSDSGLRLHLTWSPVTTEDADDSGNSDASYAIYIYDENYYPDCPYSYGVGDGWCDANRNNEECGWDNGDCCPSDCTDGSYSCASWGGDCDDCADPDSVDLAADDGTGNPGECWVPYTCGDGLCEDVLGEVGGDSGCYEDCGCLEDQFECTAGTVSDNYYGYCISESSVCSGYTYCADGADEATLSEGGSCPDPSGDPQADCEATGGFYCGDDESNWTSYSPDGCVPGAYVCANDGDDCVDGSDEATLSEGGSCPDPTCADTSCGVYITWGYSCTQLQSWGYNCDLCIAEGACSGGLMSNNGDDMIDFSMMNESDVERFVRNGDKTLTAFEIQAKVNEIMNPNHVKPAYEAAVTNNQDDSAGTYGNSRAGWRQIGSGNYYHYSESGLDAMNFSSSTYGYGDTVGPYMVTSVNNTGQESAQSNEVSATFPVLEAPSNLRAVYAEGDDDDGNPITFINLNWDYEGYEPAPYAECTGTIGYIGDGDCDTYNNNAECGWDGGDCCEETCVPGTTYQCDSVSDTTDSDGDGCWDLCYDPDTSCGSGIPTCALDYSDLNFGVVAGLCYLNSNTYVITWNDGCDGEIWKDGEYFFSASDFDPPQTLTGYGPEESHLFEFRNSDGDVVASETESTTNEDCSGDVASNDDGHTSYDFVSSREVKMSIDPPADEEYRLAEGFKLYNLDADDEWQLVTSGILDVQYQYEGGDYGCYAVSAYDTSPSYETALSNEACIEAPGCPLAGDPNSDGVVNVSDIVLLVGAILNNAGSVDGVECGDSDENGVINVSDIVSIVNIILNGRVASIDDATESTIIISDNALRVEANGFVQGVQITLSHGDDFSINLVDAYISEYKTSDNMTTLVVVTDGSSSLNEIASINGDCKVEDVHVASSIGDVAVEEIIELANFQVDVVGPNPFNPSTQLNIVVPDAGYVSVKVYNVLGQEVANLVDGYMEASSSGYMVNWNAGNLASGVYIVRAATAGQISTQKLMLLK